MPSEEHTSMNHQTREPDNPAAWALARHIADHPVSTVQAAFRYLNTPLTIELHDDAPAGVAPATDRGALVELGAQAIWAQYSDAEPSRNGLVMANPHAAAAAVLAVLPEPASDRVQAVCDQLHRAALLADGQPHTDRERGIVHAVGRIRAALDQPAVLPGVQPQPEDPADELRAAADKLRPLAEAAQHDLETADYWEPYDPARAWADGFINGFGGACSDLVAVLPPAAVIKLARWLQSAARDAVEIGPDPHALAVARAINRPA
jgi:hypothetical protein